MRGLPRSLSALFVVLAGALAALPLQAQFRVLEPESDFMKFFNFSEVEHTLLTDGREHTLYRPGGQFGDQVLLSVLSSDAGVEATILAVHRSFLDGPMDVFARDVVGSFVDGLAPTSQDVAAFVEAIKGWAEGAPDVPSTQADALAVVAGMAAEARLAWPDIELTFEQGEDPSGEPSLLVKAHRAGGPAPADPGQGPSGIRDAEEVGTLLIRAARQRTPSLLREVCHPALQEDGDIQALCALADGQGDPTEFYAAFEAAQLDGETRIVGSERLPASAADQVTLVAEVPVRIGPDAGRAESIVVARIEGIWYLLGF